MEQYIGDAILAVADVLVPFNFLSLAFTALLIMAALLMIIYSFSDGFKLPIDYSGLVIGTGILCLYVLMPLGPGFNYQLDPKIHSYFSIHDAFTYVVAQVLSVVTMVWTVIRIVIIRKVNFGLSLLFYALLNIASFGLGFRFAGAWAS